MKFDKKLSVIFTNAWENIFINIYPNPATNYLQIHSNSRIEQISILDIQGSIILDQYNDKEINTSNWETGNYFIKIKTENKIFQENIIIQ